MKNTCTIKSIVRITQVATMFLPMSAHWRHLPNTIQLEFPSANPSSQPKWQINQLSHFAQLTVECRWTCPGMSFPLIVAPSHGDLGPI